MRVLTVSRVGSFVTCLVRNDEGALVGMRVVSPVRDTEVDFEALGRSRGARSVPVLLLLSLVVRERLPLCEVELRRSAMILDFFWRFDMLVMLDGAGK